MTGLWVLLLNIVDNEDVILFLHQPVSISMDIHNLKALVFFQVFPETGNKYIHAAAGEIGIFSPNFKKSFVFLCG